MSFSFYSEEVLNNKGTGNERRGEKSDSICVVITDKMMDKGESRHTHKLGFIISPEEGKKRKSGARDSSIHPKKAKIFRVCVDEPLLCVFLFFFVECCVCVLLVIVIKPHRYTHTHTELN